MSMRTYGAKRFREAVQRGIDLAKFAEAELRRQPALWEVITPATIGIVCFSVRHWRERVHQERAKAVSDSGFACVPANSVKGRSVLRLCTINPLTNEDDIRETIRRLGER